ncbi:MAG: EamA family transporter [Anaerolineae bacterium]|nr:EamA family transporter [Anaerolineae bacterium]
MSQSTTTRETKGLENPDMIGSLAVLIATACWGTSGLFVKLILANQEVSALALAFWRDLSTFLVLFIGLRLMRPSWLTVERKDTLWLVGLGASIGVFHIFWNLAVFLNGAAVATVQQAAMPAIVAIVAWLIWDEPLSARKILAIALTFVGTVLVSGVSVLGEADLTVFGFLVGLGTPITYASWNLFIKKIRDGYNPFTTLTYGFGFGALVLLPIQFFTPQPQGVPPSTLLYFIGLIIIATIGGFSIYTFALGRLQASVASILAMAEIPIVAVYAYVLLGERMSIDQVIGAVLVVAGVLMLSRRRKKRIRPTEREHPEGYYNTVVEHEP